MTKKLCILVEVSYVSVVLLNKQQPQDDVDALKNELARLRLEYK